MIVSDHSLATVNAQWWSLVFQYIHLVNTICHQLPEVEKPVLSELTTDGELKDRLEILKQRKQVYENQTNNVFGIVPFYHISTFPQFADAVSKQLKIVQGCSTGR